MTLYHFQITNESFQNYSAIDLLPVLWFMCQSQAHFHEQFQAEFFGWLSKKATKSSIIDLDSYTILHFNANMSWYASVSQ